MARRLSVGSDIAMRMLTAKEMLSKDWRFEKFISKSIEEKPYDYAVPKVRNIIEYFGGRN